MNRLARVPLALALIAMPASGSIIDWDCRSIAVFAAIVAVDRDAGISRHERLTMTMNGLFVATGELDQREYTMLSRLVGDVYQSDLSPRVTQERVYFSCHGQRRRWLERGT